MDAGDSSMLAYLQQKLSKAQHHLLLPPASCRLQAQLLHNLEKKRAKKSILDRILKHFLTCKFIAQCFHAFHQAIDVYHGLLFNPFWKSYLIIDASSQNTKNPQRICSNKEEIARILSWCMRVCYQGTS